MKSLSLNVSVRTAQQPDLSDIVLPAKEKKFKGYFKISRHYRWALGQVFDTFNHSTVLILEDDLDIAPDIFDYFTSTYPLLRRDPTLWCVSAWNDNGEWGAATSVATGGQVQAGGMAAFRLCSVRLWEAPVLVHASIDTNFIWCVLVAMLVFFTFDFDIIDVTVLSLTLFDNASL